MYGGDVRNNINKHYTHDLVILSDEVFLVGCGDDTNYELCINLYEDVDHYRYKYPAQKLIKSKVSTGLKLPKAAFKTLGEQLGKL